ncbi:hypothetical protein BDV06DRAFT_71341 [Aspergillus oleicola]
MAESLIIGLFNFSCAYLRVGTIKFVDIIHSFIFLGFLVFLYMSRRCPFLYTPNHQSSSSIGPSGFVPCSHQPHYIAALCLEIGIQTHFSGMPFTYLFIPSRLVHPISRYSYRVGGGEIGFVESNTMYFRYVVRVHTSQLGVGMV